MDKRSCRYKKNLLVDGEETFERFYIGKTS